MPLGRGTEGVQLVAADYHARLETDDVLVLQGDATLTITGPAARRTLLPLEPLGPGQLLGPHGTAKRRPRRRWGETPTAASGSWSSGPAG